MMLEIDGIAGLRTLVGLELGVSNWHRITQSQVADFARVTDDHNWVHIDEARAAASPFGTTIVHGLLTLGLEPKFSNEIYDIKNIEYSLDYGYQKIRFPTPVPVGSRLRMRATLDHIVDIEGGVRCVVVNTFELDGSEKPACVAELILHIAGR